MYSILCVCTGNICRSPTAEGVLRHALNERGLADKVRVSSAGITGFHAGEKSDHRSVAMAKKHGIDMSGILASQLTPDDFNRYDLILAMDETHLIHMQRMAPKNAKAEVALFLPYCGNETVRDVPDPYYGDDQEFQYVLDLIVTGVNSLCDKLQPTLR